MKQRFFSIWKRFGKIISGEKFTLIIVPDNQSKVKNFNISKLRFLSLLFIFFTLFSFSTITLGRYCYYSIREMIYTSKHAKFEKEMSHLLSNSGKIMIAQEKFNSTLNGLLSDLGLKSAINLQVGLGGPLVDIDDSKNKTSQSILPIPDLDKMSSSSEEVDILQNLSNNAQLVEKKIHLLTKKVKTFESIVQFIPSIWPLRGEGKIIDSSNGVMLINTIPFTPVIATAEGKVAGINFLDQGMKVTLLHKYQFISTYNGLFQVSPSVKKGAMIRKGDIIGYVSKNKGTATLRYGLFIGNHRGIYPLDPLGFSYMGR